MAMTDLSLILVHYPVLDKNGHVVTTALTNMDIHDIARTARTFGVKRFFIATPVKPLRSLAQKIMDHWETGYGSHYNENRKDALGVVRLETDLDTTIVALERETGQRPRLIMTSARPGAARRTFAEFREELANDERPHLMVLGTGWGLTDDIMARADVTLEPVWGPTDYNHLSVRSAAAIMLDRLRGER